MKTVFSIVEKGHSITETALTVIARAKIKPPMIQRQTQSAVDYSLPIPLPDFHILLAEIATGQSPLIDVSLLRTKAAPLSNPQYWTRISLLLDMLRVSEDRG